MKIYPPPPSFVTINKQQEIVKKLNILEEQRDRLIDAINLNKALFKNYLAIIFEQIKKSNIKFELLKNVCKIISGKHQPKVEEPKFWDNENGFPWLRVRDLTSRITTTTNKLSQLGIETEKNGLFKKETMVIALVGSIGKVGWLKGNCFSSVDVFNIISKTESIILNHYLYFYFLHKRKRVESLKNGTGILRVKIYQLNRLKIPLPPITEQKEIVKKLNAFSNYQFKREQELTKTDFLLKNSIRALIN